MVFWQAQVHIYLVSGIFFQIIQFSIQSGPLKVHLEGSSELVLSCTRVYFWQYWTKILDLVNISCRSYNYQLFVPYLLSLKVSKGVRLTQLSPYFEWLGFPNHLKTQPFEIRSSKSLDFICFPILNGWISDPHCIYTTGLVCLVGKLKH